MDWTDEQKEAIVTSGQNILVAAGAGSGKTAVLVTRIVRRILGDDGVEPCDVDRLLIVTFSNAAAAEMRQRLYLALQKRMAEETDEKMLRRIYLQQTLLSKAHITTIDSFCNSVVTCNSKESGVDGSFRIGEESETDLLLTEAAEAVCEAFSLEHPDIYGDLVDIYGDYRSDVNLVELLIRIVKFISSFPDPGQWLQTCADFYHVSHETDFAQTVWGQALLQDILQQTEAFYLALLQLQALAEEWGADPYIQTLQADIAAFQAAFAVLRQPTCTWEEARMAVQRMVLGSLNKCPNKPKALADFSARRNKINDKIRKFLALYFGANVPGPMEQIAMLAEDVHWITYLVQRLQDTFQTMKRSRHLLDYSDLEHIALQVLSVPGVADRYRRQFAEVYIDEYQDTNMIQEAILRSVSGNYEGGVPNIFMVGDIKQSVYGFRQACPDLFLEKYRQYAEDEQAGHRVCLYKNFRSRRAVLNTVNQIFHTLMHQHTCGMDYTVSEYLNYGAAYYDEQPELPTQPNPDRSTQVVVVDATGFTDKHLPEMHEVARRIRQLIQDQFPVYDGGQKIMRPVTYGDICILLRSRKQGKSYRDYFLSQGIPAYYEEKSGFYQRPEVGVLMAFLNVLDNPRQDIPLVAVLRNIYGCSEELLARVALNDRSKGRCFLERCDAYARINGGVLQNILQRLATLRKAAAQSPVSETVWRCMHENGFFDAFEQVPGGLVAQQNLLLLMNQAVRYDRDTNRGLFLFVHRLDVAKRRQSKAKSATRSGGGAQAVQIMTIHGSKGLEFPVVFLCNTSEPRNTNDEKQGLLLHRTAGFGPKGYDRKRKLVFSSLMRRAVQKQVAKDSKAEELRVLYVALTRARDKLYITGHVSKRNGQPYPLDEYLADCMKKCAADTGQPLDYYILNAETHLEQICMALCHQKCTPDYRIEGALYTDELEDLKARPDQIEPVTFGLPAVPLYDVPAAAAIEPVQTVPRAPAKVSVSELKRLRASWQDEGGDSSPKQYRKTASAQLTAAQIGTLLHSVLQQVDYGRLSQDTQAMTAYAAELLTAMVTDKFISETERQAVPVSLLVQYLVSDFAAQLSRGRLWREVPFTYLMPWQDVVADGTGQTAVQGVIDLVAMIDQRLVLVDFKSDSVETDFAAYSARYRTQLEIYAQACQRAFGKMPDEVYLYYLRAGHEERIIL